MFATGYSRVLQPVDGLSSLQQAICQSVGIVIFVADEIARRRSRHTRNGAGHRFGKIGFDHLEWASKGFEFAVEVYAHLIGERPAGRVVGAVRWSARIGKVVG